MDRLSDLWATLRSRVPPVLILLAVIAGGVWLFVELAEEVQEGSVEAFDTRVLLAFRTPDDRADPLGPLWFEGIMRDVTSLGGVVVLSLVTAAVAGYLLLTGRSRISLFLIAAVVSGALLTFMLKELFGRSRPALVPGIDPVLSASFPSGHAMMATVTYLTLAALLARAEDDRRVRAYLLGVATLLSLLIGISRVYLAVHWPTDVLAGWSAGAIWATLAWIALRWLQHRGAAEEPGEPDETA